MQVQSPQSISKQPRGLYVLFMAEMWDRFSFYGTSALLILYLTHIFLFSDATANNFYGAYSALGFALPVIGGLLADRFLGFQRAIILGALGIIMGNAILAIPLQSCMYLGISLSICGMGLFKGNITSLVGTLYTQDDPRRDGGFTIFYMGMNLGAILGPIVYGFVALKYGWHYSFGLSAILMLSGLIIFLLYYKRFIFYNPNKSRLISLTKKVIFNITLQHIFYLSLLTCIILITILLYYPKIANELIGIYCIAVFLAVAISAFRRNAKERNRILALVLLNFFTVFYFSASLQTGSSLTLFIDRYIDFKILGIKIPTEAFVSLQPLAIIFLAPFFALIWLFLSKRDKEPSVTVQVIFGSLLAAASFGIFALAAYSAGMSNKFYSISYIVIGNILLGAGELCIVPTVIAAIAKYSPNNLLSTLIGVFFMSSALAGYVGSLMANLAGFINYHTTNTATIYVHGFIEIAIIMLSASFIIIMFLPVLRWLLAKDV